jgi:hypothetical protein
MKILINESRLDDLVKKILKRNGIKVFYNLFSRYDGMDDTQFDSVQVWFQIPNGTITRTIHFITKNNKVIGIDSYGRFSNVIPEFSHIPIKIVSDYFIEEAKKYAEKLLPLEYPIDN